MHASMGRRGGLCLVRWLGAMLLLAGTAGGTAATDCVPTWVATYGAPVVAGGPAVDLGTSEAGLRTQFDTLIEFPVTSEVFCTGPDDSPTLSYFYAGNYPGNTVTQHVVDTALQHTEGPLPIPYGQSWLAADLDLDGNTELVLQRGDGSNGFLDIVSAPNWTLRAHIVFAGMNVYFYPVALNVDDDPFPELYLTPSSLGGTARAVLVKYAPDSGNFLVVSNISAPNGTGGSTAAGDFDADGYVEFITGSSSAYYLYECINDALINRGTVGQSYAGMWAAEMRPLPDGRLFALLGHSSFTNGYRYQLIRASGDNTFVVEQVWQEQTGYAGMHPCYGLDSDGDGLDEVEMNLYPMARVYDWNAGTGSWDNVWNWDQRVTGTLLHWDRSDIDRDGIAEWCCVNHNNLFRAIEDSDANPGSVPEPFAGAPGVTLLAAPNPFVASTRLLLRAPADGAARPVALLDAAGRCVRSWALPQAGTFEWDGRDATGEAVPAGVYYLRAIGDAGPGCRLIRVR